MTARSEPQTAQLTVGALLRQARTSAGLTQAQLAAGITSVGYISLLESGQRAASREVLEAFASRLGVDVGDLGVVADAAHAAYCLNAAMVAIAQGAFESARELLRECLAAAPEGSLVAVDANLMEHEVSLRDGASTDEVASAALAALERWAEASQQTKSRVIISVLRRLHDDGDLSLACDVGQRWLARARDQGWPEDTLTELMCMTATCLAQRGDFMIAGRLTEEALQLAQRIGAPRALVHANWELGWIEHQRGDFKRANRRFKDTLRMCEAAELTDMLPRVQLAAISVLLDTPEPDIAALTTLSENALLAATYKEDRTAIAYALVAKSRAALLAGRFSEAEDLAERGLSMPEAAPNSRVDLALTRLQASIAGGALLHWPDASLLADVERLRASGNHRALARFWAELAAVFESAGEAALALQACKSALASAGVLPGMEDTDSVSLSRER